MRLREVYKDHGRFKKRAKELQKWICKEFSEEKKYQEYISLLEEYVLPHQQEVQEIEDLFDNVALSE